VKTNQISRRQLGEISSKQQTIAPSWTKIEIAAQISQSNSDLLDRSGGQSWMTFDTFSERIKIEFVTNSGIDPELFQASVSLVRDIETGAGGEISAPIHEALNWRYTRFGQQSRDTLYGALLLNADGSPWQAKLSRPRTGAKGKAQKYETPVGNGARAFLPEVPPEIRKLIGLRYGVEVPLTGSFWDWLEQQSTAAIGGRWMAPAA
jgi:hypothetical protein